MRKRRFIIMFSAVFLLVFFLSSYYIKPALNSLSGFLSKTEHADGNILVIEGWLSYNDLLSAIDEFKKGHYEYIFTTGLKSTTEYYGVNTDGYLVFYPGINFTSRDSRKHTIEVKAFSELDGENSAHFNLWVNDSVVADFFPDKTKRKYSVTVAGLSKIDSVMVQFDNDKVGEFGDRNLFVKEIIIDHNNVIPFLFHSEYDILELDGKNRVINNMNSNAELTRNRLLSMGVDSSAVIALPGRRVRVNRTLTSALAVRDWLQTAEINVTGMNIVSAGTHSRRTWMTFKRVLDKPFDIGIIALPDNRNNKSNRLQVIKTIRETVAIIYYWLILIPY